MNSEKMTEDLRPNSQLDPKWMEINRLSFEVGPLTKGGRSPS